MEMFLLAGFSMLLAVLFPLGASGKELAVDLSSPQSIEQFHLVGEGAGVAEDCLILNGVKFPGTKAFLVAGPLRFAELSFEFRLEPAGAGAHGCGAILGSTNSIEFTGVHLDRYQQVILYRSSAGKDWDEVERQTGLAYQPAEWHSASLRVEGEKLQIAIDGKNVLSRPSPPLIGLVGFYVSDGHARFRKIRCAGDPQELPSPWKVIRHHIYVCQDAGAGGYEAFPDVARLRSEELVCVFYAGFAHVSLPGYAPGGKLPPECPKAGRVALARSRDSGLSWTPAETVIDTELDDRDPSIAELPGDTLLVNFFSLRSGPKGKGYEFVHTAMVTSKDQGRTWSEPRPLFTDWAASSPARRLSDGRLAMALYYVGAEKAPGGGYGGISFSEDGGRSWLKPVEVGKSGPLKLDAEPDVVEFPGGELLMALRPILAFSRSSDRGRIWTRPEPAGWPGDAPYFLLTRSGLLLLGHRHPGTSLHYSLDNGKTWSAGVPIDSAGGAYPSMAELADGTVIVVYYEEGVGSSIRARRFKPTPKGVEWIAY
ncbi:MAG: exo-alpha-sialidase [Planctomycetes bacterium]|nr:exo-alpha-sialidase [Planctomycetota bacterium]